VTLYWDTIAGASYQLQSNAPINGTWGPLDMPVSGTGGNVTNIQPSSGTERYYRVVAQ
jgi:hypothetical protein